MSWMLHRRTLLRFFFFSAALCAVCLFFVPGREQGAVPAQRVQAKTVTVDAWEEGEDFFPLNEKTCKTFPGLDYEYNGRSKHVKLVYQGHVVTFFEGKKEYYADGVRGTFPVAPSKIKYKSKKKNAILVPLTAVFEGLGMTVEYNPEEGKYIIASAKEEAKGKYLYTGYPYSRKTYAKKEYRRMPKTSCKNYRRLLTVSRDTTGKFQFLRVDVYREIDKTYFKKYYKYLIEDYCLQHKISVKKSVLYDKADTILKTAKKYKLDPVYFTG